MQPVVVDLLRGVDVEEVEVVAHLRALHARGQLEDLLIEHVAVDTVAIIYAVVKESSHGLVMYDVLLAELQVSGIYILWHALFIEDAVLLVHVVHVMLTGI